MEGEIKIKWDTVEKNLHNTLHHDNVFFWSSEYYNVLM